MTHPIQSFATAYSDESFWEKVKRFALKAGKEVIEKALILYYSFSDKDTPVWAKGVLLAALGYFISSNQRAPRFKNGNAFVAQSGYFCSHCRGFFRKCV
jgi:hypothetical protein